MSSPGVHNSSSASPSQPPPPQDACGGHAATWVQTWTIQRVAERLGRCSRDRKTTGALGSRKFHIPSSAGTLGPFELMMTGKAPRGQQADHSPEALEVGFGVRPFSQSALTCYLTVSLCVRGSADDLMTVCRGELKAVRNRFVGFRGPWSLGEILSSYATDDGALKVVFEMRDIEITSTSKIEESHVLAPDLQTCVAQMQQDSSFADFDIECKGKVFPCHKFMLAARSDVFAAMLSNKSMMESQANKITIDDVSHESMSKFLKYLYSDASNTNQHWQRSFTFDQLCELLHLSDKYNVVRLKTEMAKYAANCKLTAETATELLVLADRHSVQDLEEIVLEFMAENTLQVMSTESWRRMVQEQPQMMERVLRQKAVMEEKKKKEAEQNNS